MSTDSSDIILDEAQLLQALRALRNGDLSVRMPEGTLGTAGEIATAFNELNDLLRALIPDANRVTREIGQDGRFGGQAGADGVAANGAWKDLLDGVNLLSRRLTQQVRDIATVTASTARGDLYLKIVGDAQGEMLALHTMINAMTDHLNVYAAEVTRINREIGTEGVLGGQAEVPGATGTWKDLVDSVNSMAANLTNQLRDMNNVTRAAVNGDLSQRVTVNARQETLELKNNINALLEKLSNQEQQAQIAPILPDEALRHLT